MTVGTCVFVHTYICRSWLPHKNGGNSLHHLTQVVLDTRKAGGTPSISLLPTKLADLTLYAKITGHPMPMTLPRTPTPTQGLDTHQCQVSACKRTQFTPNFTMMGGCAEPALGRVRAALFCTRVHISTC